ncbi:MAG: hypothetical protein HZB76_04885 [Chlamydiae bacterium]|nr:hypothetical protein [Chlamydiota bacterium]
MRKQSIAIILFFCFFGSISAEEFFPKAKTQEEALFLRRIAEFFQDEEYDLVKIQIEEYLTTYKESSLNEYLFAIMGNILTNEKNYSQAINYFEKIQSAEIKEKSTVNFLRCLSELKNFAKIKEECESYLQKNPESPLNLKIKLLLAESIYNQALTDKDNQTALLKEAKGKFEELIGSVLENDAIEHLSQIHAALKEHETAAKFYFELAEKNPNKKEDYLFQAASVQACFNKEEALKTFSLVFEAKKNKSKEAAFNKMLLLLELKKYDELLLLKDSLAHAVPKDKLQLSHFFMAEALVEMKDYEKALIELNLSLENANLALPYVKTALLTSMNCSFHLNNLDNFNLAFNQFKELFGQDQEMTKALFAKGLLNKKNQKLQEARQDFEAIQATSLSLEEKENYHYEYAHLLYELQDFAKAKDNLKFFIDNFTSSKLMAQAAKCLINASLKIIASSTQEEMVKNKNILVDDLNDLLKLQNFSIKEKSLFRFILAKTKYELNDVGYAFEEFSHLLSENESYKEPIFSSEQLAEMTLLVAYINKNVKNDPKLFCENGKKALALNPKLRENGPFLMHLFNTYIERAKEEAPKQPLIDSAAENLLLLYNQDPTKVLPNNLLWLADYFYDKTNTCIEENLAEKDKILFLADQCILLLENYLKQNSDFTKTEGAMLKLANLHKFKNDSEKQLALLEQLVNDYRKNNLTSYKEEAVFELAKVYVASNNKEKALSLYKEFLPSFNVDSVFVPFVILHEARTKLSLIDPKDFNLSNETIKTIITELKDLSLKKNIKSEPAHLQASLEYVDLLCNLVSKQQRNEKKLFLLSRIKENFSVKEDILSQDYHLGRKNDDKKNKIYQAYMMLIDAEMMLAQAEIENKDFLIQEAKALLNKLLCDKLDTTSYLFDRIKQNLTFHEDEKVAPK